MQRRLALLSTYTECLRGAVYHRRILQLIFLSLLVGSVGLLGSAAVYSDGEPADVREALTQLTYKTDLLKKQVELADGEAFYLLFDLATSRLRLMLKGALLRDYEVLVLEVGTPRVAFSPPPPGENWQARIWLKGNLNPVRDRERFELVAVPATTTTTDSGSEPAYKMPPTPEEMYPVPYRYHVRFEGGLSLEVWPQEGDQPVGFWTKTANGLRAWYRDFRTALRRDPDDALRLRMVLRPEDAASLYRALPPDTSLLVVPS